MTINNIIRGVIEPVINKIIPIDGSGLDFFSITVDTTKTGTSTNTQFQLPLISSGVYDFDVYTDQGFLRNINTYTDNIIDFGSSGVHNIYMTGTIQNWKFEEVAFNFRDAAKLLNISSFGETGKGLTFTDAGSAFKGCSNMTITATNAPLTSGCSSFSSMFGSCSSLTSFSGVHLMDLSSAIFMNNMFGACTSFNEPNVALMDLSNVRYPQFMFSSAFAFNQDLSNWNTQNFINLTAFNQNNGLLNFDLGEWDWSSVTNAQSAFNSGSVSQDNYNSLLLSLDSQSLQSGVTLDMGSTRYSSGAPAAAKANIIANYSWIINDGGEIFDPTTLNPSFWIDASKTQSLTLNGSNEVTQWTDISTNAINLEEGPGTTNLPVYTPSGINGQPAVDFDQGVWCNLEQSGIVGNTISGADEITIYIVQETRPEASSQTQQWSFNWESNSFENIYIGSPDRVVSAPDGFSFQYGFSGGGRYTTTLTGISNTATALGVIHRADDTTDIRTNGSLAATTNIITDSIVLSNAGIISIGGGNNRPAGQFWGKIAEIIVFPYALSTQQVTDVESYLLTKYSL